MFILPHEEGQGLAEYGLILVFVAIVVLVSLAAFGGLVEGLYDEIMVAIQSI